MKRYDTIYHFCANGIAKGCLGKTMLFLLNLLFQKYVIIIVSSCILMIDLIPIKEHSDTNYHFCGNGIAMSLPSKDHVVYLHLFLLSQKSVILSTWILLNDLIPNKEKHFDTNYHFCANGIAMSLPWKDNVINIWTCFCYFKSYVIIIVSSWILLIDLIPIKKHYDTNYHFCGNGIAMSLPSKDHTIFISTCFC